VSFVDDLKTTGDLDLFVSLSLLDSTPHAFGGDWKQFSEWKRDLSRGLGVDPHALVLVGSAAVGVSLNPRKSFRSFGPKSDIDVAVVSPTHFEQAWWYLRTLGSGFYGLPPAVRTAVAEHRSNYVYWGTIATDRLLPWLPFGTQWLSAAGKASARDPIADRTVNFRLYRDPSALRLYQSQGFNAARTRLLTTGI
jgi:hypothetical protein